VIRGIYGALGQKLADETDVSEKVAKYLKLKPKAAEQSEGRF